MFSFARVLAGTGSGSGSGSGMGIGAFDDASGVAERSGNNSGGAPEVVLRRAIFIGVSDRIADGANWPIFASFVGSIFGKAGFGAEACLVPGSAFGILVFGMYACGIGIGVGNAGGSSTG